MVTVSSWPVKSLIRLGFESEAEAEAMRLLEVAVSEASPVRRADALNYLLAASVQQGTEPL